MAGNADTGTDVADKHLSEEQLKAVGKKLREKFDKFKQDRRTVEQQWMKNLRQILGQYDPAFLNTLTETQSRAYPRITRQKCVSMVSRLMGLLFPMSEKNWTLAPSASPSVDTETVQAALKVWREDNPDAAIDREVIKQAVAQYSKRVAEQMEVEITDQLGDIGADDPVDYTTLARKVVESGVRYSMGILKGPMTVVYNDVEYEVNSNNEVVITDVEAYRPYMEHVSVWDYYPDLSAKTFAGMSGEFQKHVLSAHQLRRLAKRPDFKGDKIDEYMRLHPDGNYVECGYESELRTLGQDGGTSKAGSATKYEVIEFWGAIGKSELKGLGMTVSEKEEAEEVNGTIWMVDDVIIKAQRNPFPEGTQMFHKFVFEEDDVSLCGSGLPPIMRDSQMAIANAARMLLDNAASVCGPNVEVDVDRLLDGQDKTGIGPFKVWLTEGTAANGGHRAVNSISFDSHMTELVTVIRTFKEFADSETFIGQMTGGDFENVSGDTLRTTGNMNTAMATAALPFKDIVRNFDRFTSSVIHALVQWNTIFNQKPELKGDMRPVARGATSLLTKEARALALDNLSNTLSDEDMIYIDRKEVVRERLAARDLPLDRILVPDSVVKEREKQRSELAAKEQQTQEQLVNAELDNTRADTLKATSQAQRNIDVSDAQTAGIILDSLEKGIPPDEITKYMEPGAQGATRIEGYPGVSDNAGLPPSGVSTYPG